MTHRDIVSNRRTVRKTLGVLGTIGGVSGVASARNPRLELVGHTTLGARDGGNTYGAVSEQHDLAAVGSFVFNAGNELRPVDLSDPTDPEMAQPIDTGPGTDIRNVAFHPSKPWAFTANEGDEGGWTIIDLSDPYDPELVGFHTVAGEDAHGVHNVVGLDDNHVITSGHGRGIVVYNIEDPENPTEVAHFQIGDETVHATHVRGDYAYLAHWDRGMYVLDMSTPGKPQEVASFDYTEEEADVPLRNCHHAVPHPEDDIALLGEEVGSGWPGYKHLVEFDLDTGDTELLSSFQFPQHANQPTGSQGFWWTGHFSDWGTGGQQDVVFSGDYKAGVQVFDCENPEDPVRIDQYMPTKGVGEVRRKDPTRFDLVDNVPFSWNAESQLAGDSEYVYASDVTTGFYVLELEGY